MSWSSFHTESERLAASAEQAARLGQSARAESLYLEAAAAEALALRELPPEKARTRGITAVSAVALAYKGRDYEAAEGIAHSELATGTLVAFAAAQLRDLLSLLWTSRAAEQVGVKFVAGDILVSVKGGEIIHGGAPLDLIVREVEGIQSVLYRTLEMLLDKPFRRHGRPSVDLQSMVRPWLFQAPAGSYQFAVRVQEPAQMELFEAERPHVEQVTSTFFRILRASSSNPEEELAAVVEDEEYRKAFLNLARNLAPTGKTFDRLEVRDAGSPSEPVAAFIPNSRQRLNSTLSRTKPVVTDEVVTLKGVLRALHLDQDWLEVTVPGPPEEHIKVEDTGDALDDVVGPMVNRQVRVLALRRGGKYMYRDIELEE